MPHEVMMTFGERLLDLIGYTGANAVDHPWYTGPVYLQCIPSPTRAARLTTRPATPCTSRYRGPVYTQPYLGGGRGSTAGDGVQF